jgi:hypothetical protein
MFPPELGLVEALFLLAAFVCVPLAFRLLGLPRARRLAFPAAVLAALSFLVPKGSLAATLAAPWLLVDLVAAAAALRLRHPLATPAFLFLPVGGGHLVAHRAGLPVLGFPDEIVLLTAVHFHYTAFITPLLALLASRGPWRPLALAGGAGVLLATPLTAVGFIFSPALKTASVALLAASTVAIALAQLRADPGRTLSRVLLGISSLSIVAGIYEIGAATRTVFLSIPFMTATHGVLNACGFSLCGLLAWFPATGSRSR